MSGQRRQLSRRLSRGSEPRQPRAVERKVSRQAITIQGKSGANYLVSEGVKNGDRIVLQGLDHLQEGQIIQPTQAPKASAVAAKVAAAQSVQN